MLLVEHASPPKYEGQFHWNDMIEPAGSKDELESKRIDYVYTSKYDILDPIMAT